MTAVSGDDAGGKKEAGLRLRDWFLLGLIGLLTVAALAGAVELVARRMFTEAEVGKDRCRTFIDPASGQERFASCAYLEKEFETDWVENRVNSGGYRSDVEFGPKAPGTYRIVLVGSSFAWGGGSARDKTFAALLPAALSARTGKTIELYNQSIPGPPGLPQNVDRRFKDTLALKPDLVLWVLTRWDIKEASNPNPAAEQAAGPQVAQTNTPSRFKQDLAQHEFANAARDLEVDAREWLRAGKGELAASRSAFLLQHFLNESDSQFVKYSLTGPDEIAGYLRTDPSPAWQERLKDFDGDVADIAAQARAAGVPFAVAYVPSRVQAAMISMNTWPAGYDPYKLDDELGPIVQSHGGSYLMLSSSMHTSPKPESGYFPVDGHLNPDGNMLVSKQLSSKLTSGIIPGLAAASPQRAASN